MVGSIELCIKDYGTGFDVKALLSKGKGMGLTSMRERTELSGGSFKIESRIGQGTTIRACWAIGKQGWHGFGSSYQNSRVEKS